MLTKCLEGLKGTYKGECILGKYFRWEIGGVMAQKAVLFKLTCGYFLKDGVNEVVSGKPLTYI